MVFDLTVAVEVGLVLACVLFVRRMGELFRAEPVLAEGLVDAAVRATADTSASAPESITRPRRVWCLHGALFFGAAAKIDPIVAAIEAGPEALELWLDLRDLFALDTTGLEGLEQILKAVGQRGGRLHLLHAQAQPQSLLQRSGFNAHLAAQNAKHSADLASNQPLAQ